VIGWGEWSGTYAMDLSIIVFLHPPSCPVRAMSCVRRPREKHVSKKPGQPHNAQEVERDKTAPLDSSLTSSPLLS